MGETDADWLHNRGLNTAAAAILLAAAGWAFVSGFTRELGRPVDLPIRAKVVVAQAPPPAQGFAPLETYAVAAPQPRHVVRRHEPTPGLASDASTGVAAAQAAETAPSAGAAGVPAQAQAPEPPAQPPAAPPETPPG